MKNKEVKDEEKKFILTSYDKFAKQTNQIITSQSSLIDSFKKVLTVRDCEKLDAGLPVWSFSGKVGESPSIRIEALD